MANLPYEPFPKMNDGNINKLPLEYNKGDLTYYLNYDDGSSITTYVLTDWQGSNQIGNVPTQFDQGWSLNITTSPCKKTIGFEPAQSWMTVLDSNYNAYVLIGKSAY